LPGYTVEYTTPDNEKFKTYQEASRHISNLAKSVTEVNLNNVKIKEKQKIESVDDIDVDKFEIRYDDKPPVECVKIDGKWYKVIHIFPDFDGDGIVHSPISNEKIVSLFNSDEGFKTSDSNIKAFIEKNKEYEQSKEIIDEWKKVNNIQYNPEEIYSRGQEFSSVVGAYSSFDVNLMMQNLLQHIEDNEKAGGKFAISAYTKPIDKKIGHLEGGGGKIKFKIFPKSEDILWASNIDVFSGSVWDASEKVNKDKKSELLGVSYTKYPSLKSIETIQPNLANIIDNLAHAHNELGIVLTGNNFRLEYDEDTPYQTKKIINAINGVLDQKYGKLVKPEINPLILIKKKVYSVWIDEKREERMMRVTFEEAQEFIKLHASRTGKSIDAYTIRESFIKEIQSIQPTQTNDNLKESINSIKNKLNVKNIEQVPDEFEGYTIQKETGDLLKQGVVKKQNNVWKINNKQITEEQVLKLYSGYLSKSKEYTSQALINTKIAALKEVAKKYPRSLIRSEVKQIDPFSPFSEGFRMTDKFQKIDSENTTSIKPGVEELFDSNPKLANQVYEVLGIETLKQSSTNIASTIYELIPNITEDKIDKIYNNYVSLINKARKDKEISKESFKTLLKSYQVFNYKDTYIFGNYDTESGVFITRVNSSPSSRELLAEALPILVKQGIDFASFVPKDVADKYRRSGYSVSTQGFDYNFKGEDMVKYLAVSNPNVSLKIFNKSLNELLNTDIENYNNSIGLKYNPVEIKGDLIEKAGKDASKIFETYLTQFGIKVKDINEIKDRLGIDELGFADILSKIAYVKDRKDLPPIAGEFIAYMMQYNPLVSDIIKDLSQTSSYKNLNKDEYFKIIGGLIAQDLQNKLKGNYSKSLLEKLKQLIKDFFSLLNNTPVNLINKNIGIISNNILQQNKKLITSSLYKPGAFGKSTKQVSLQESMESDKFGASIIENLSKKGFILTGSTSLGEQGTIQRPDENLLHDIDWVSPFNRKQTEETFKEVYSDALKILILVLLSFKKQKAPSNGCELALILANTIFLLCVQFMRESCGFLG
jgi:hypothetical protein